jgi:hypothetical protein
MCDARTMDEYAKYYTKFLDIARWCSSKAQGNTFHTLWCRKKNPNTPGNPRHGVLV